MFNRVIHLTSIGFLSGSIILNYFFNTSAFLSDDASFVEFANPFAGLLALATGILNMIMLKPKKEPEAEE